MIAVVGFFSLSGHEPRPSEGDVYVRTALDSSVAVPLVLHDTTTLASPLARRLVLHLLTTDIRVRIDHVGRCGDIVDRYVAFNEHLGSTAQDSLEVEFQTRRPVLLAARLMDECFSYTVKYDVPLREPMRWRNDLLVQVPVQLALIHPMADFRQFRKE